MKILRCQVQLQAVVVCPAAIGDLGDIGVVAIRSSVAGRVGSEQSDKRNRAGKTLGNRQQKGLASIDWKSSVVLLPT